ncbi:hypothetical protein Gogos_010157 [Gossypium gossypioides]|uniref:Prolamin-like domain-containing protein n=1 Tax=Gossypium gossypioides TaxID=34282 RepID=A0A7J9BK97_GOSGO|nr:hypothetical protein [Gossypium gossypioides]
MSVPRKPSPLLLNLAFMAMFITVGNAQQLLHPFPLAPMPSLAPFQPSEAQKCWSVLTSIQGCMLEISASFFYGEIGVIGPDCCQAITHISDDCWLKMFPFNPFSPPFLRTSCSSPAPSAGPILNGINKVSSPLQSGSEVDKCWSSLSNVNGCVTEIINSFFGGQMFTIISPACCNAIMKLNDDCWPILFPFYPYFPPYLKNYCGETATATPPK